MKIGLFGIYGLYNYGCEAIVRGTSEFITAINPNAEIIYYSPNAKEDQNVLRDTSIKVEPIAYTKTNLERVINYVFRKLRIQYQFGYKRASTIMCESDVLFSVGGDIYTIPAYLRKKKQYPYYNSLVQQGDFLISHGKKLIIYGASIGPFGENKRAVDYYRKHFMKIDTIICRETLSVDYLNTIGIENVKMMPDPAFYVKDNCTDAEERKYIGINLSPLSLKEIYGDVSLAAKERIAKLLNSIICEFNMPILLIPHVVSPNKIDNDYLFMNELVELIPDENKTQIEIYNPSSFIGTKRALRRCRIVASARMHCSINAIQENTPTIFLTYSQKAEGMAKYVYGTDLWSLPITEIETRLIPKIKALLSEEHYWNEQIRRRNDDIFKEQIDSIEENPLLRSILSE